MIPLSFWVVMSVLFIFTLLLILELFLLSDLREEFRKHNKLYQCSNKDCNKIARQYQIQNSKNCCPYCGKLLDIRSVIKNPYKWMKHHYEFKQHNVIEFIKYKKLIKGIEKSRQEEESFNLWIKLWLK